MHTREARHTTNACQAKTKTPQNYRSKSCKSLARSPHRDSAKKTQTANRKRKACKKAQRKHRSESSRAQRSLRTNEQTPRPNPNPRHWNPTSRRPAKLPRTRPQEHKTIFSQVAGIWMSILPCHNLQYPGVWTGEGKWPLWQTISSPRWCRYT